MVYKETMREDPGVSSPRRTALHSPPVWRKFVNFRWFKF